MKILFVLKKRSSYQVWSTYSYGTLSSGLSNSVSFISKALQGLKFSKGKFETKLVELDDNNGIDKEISVFDPDIVIIEALWVIPEKFSVLTALHPTVKFIVRLHSETPFLANEGIALSWIFGYLKYANVSVAANSPRLYKELKTLLKSNSKCFHSSDKTPEKKIYYLPNYYPKNNACKERSSFKDEYIHIGCFGAIRPLKNQLIQAIAAIKFADMLGKKLKFYINGTRSECQGDSVYKNLTALFSGMTNHELIEIEWLDHDNFLDYIKRNIDIGLQVSFTETFNIVSADFVSQNIPVVTSNEVKFINGIFQANPTEVNSIVLRMYFAYFGQIINLQALNSRALINNSKKVLCQWKKSF
jgi:hypothetical protein